MHGDEPSSVRVAEAFAASLERDPPPTGVRVVVIPGVNPDGLKAGTRSNSVGVDINRDFPSRTWRSGSKESRYYPGEKPMSEPETRASVKLIKKWRPALLISIHAPLQCVNWDGPAENVSGAMAQASGFPLCRDIGYDAFRRGRTDAQR
jgi:murein peptide amidase A